MWNFFAGLFILEINLLNVIFARKRLTVKIPWTATFHHIQTLNPSCAQSAVSLYLDYYEGIFDSQRYTETFVCLTKDEWDFIVFIAQHLPRKKMTKCCSERFKGYRYERNSFLMVDYLKFIYSPFKRNFLGKQFGRRHIRDTHERRHRGEKKYSCSFCIKRFMSSQQLKNHIRVHTGLVYL